MSKRETATTDSIWLCSCLIYLGYPLCSITEAGYGSCIYRVQVAALDFDDIKREYEENRLSLSSAKAFVDSFNQIVTIQKDYRRRGMSGYSSPDYINGAIG